MSGESRGRGRSGRGSDKLKDSRSAPYPKREGEGYHEKSGRSLSRSQGGDSKTYPRGSRTVAGRSGSRVEERGQGEGSGSMKGRQVLERREGLGEPVGEKKFHSFSEGSEAGSTSGAGDRGGSTSGAGDRGGSTSGAGDQAGSTSGAGDGAGSTSGAGDRAVTSQEPGGRRGRAVRDIIETKPKSCGVKQGFTGSPITLTTNYFDIESMPNWVLYQYQVVFDVEETRERVKKAWLYKHKDTIGGAYIFDGNHLYTYRRLTNNIPDILKLQTLSREGINVRIELKFCQELHRGHSAYFQVFNVLIRRCLSSLNLQLVQRNYYDPSASVPLPQHYLEIWPGYVTSIRQHDGGIMMCTKVSHKIMRTDTAFHILRDCTNTPDYRRNFQLAMIGAVVLTEYTNKTYQIADVDFDKNPMSTFMFQGREITFVDYYKQRYNINLRDLKQPLLATRKVEKKKGDTQKKTQEILLVPELCRMTGLSVTMLNNKGLMKDMANITRVPPIQRIRRLEAFNNRLHSHPQVLEDFRDWGLGVGRRLKTIKARILPPETIQAGCGKTFSSGRDCDWIVPLRSSQMHSSGTLSRWVFITTVRLKDTVERFLPALKRAADGMRIRLPPPIIMTTKSENASEIVDMIEKSLAMHNPDLIAFGFSNDRQDRYSAVKRKCCVDRGVSSQVILLRSMTSKGVMSIATKIAIQIHTKVGGVPWTIPIPTETCMVVGFDVCHDSSSKSVGAMVASTSPNMSTWYSSVNQHSSREEVSFFLANDIFKALVKYLDKNKMLPDKLIVYRDGVGEGQIPHVLENEVNVLKLKLTELYGGESWKMCYIIVTKRIHTRFFYNNQNPVPGTIVDDDITLPERYDFYLVSQSVKQGTVTPTQYNIVSDNVGWSPDIMQRFTYKLTHLYYNSSSPVQVPAPCQYAHKLAFLANQCLHGSHHPNLDEKLYFL